MAVDQVKIENWFRHHRVRPEQQRSYKAVRDAARSFADTVLAHTPTGADQSDAIRKIREAMFIAHSSISCNGR